MLKGTVEPAEDLVNGVPNSVLSNRRLPCDQRRDTTPLGLAIISRAPPRVGAERANPGLADAIPSGLNAGGADAGEMTDTIPSGLNAGGADAGKMTDTIPSGLNAGGADAGEVKDSAPPCCRRGVGHGTLMDRTATDAQRFYHLGMP